MRSILLAMLLAACGSPSTAPGKPAASGHAPAVIAPADAGARDAGSAAEHGHGHGAGSAKK